MKTNKQSSIATLAEAKKGVAFTSINSLPPFVESDYMLRGNDD